MTSNHHAPYDLGYTRATMVGTKRSEAVTWSKPHKANLSSDCRLQLAYMKLESLVIANQNVAVNTFPGLVHTARPTTRVYNTRSRWSNLQRRKPPTVGAMIGVKSYQGSRIGRCGWITSFLRETEHL